MRNYGLDPEEHVGFAFGSGLERLTMLRYGIDDTFASRVNFLSTILCAVTLPIMTYFLL